MAESEAARVSSWNGLRRTTASGPTAVSTAAVSAKPLANTMGKAGSLARASEANIAPSMPGMAKSSTAASGSSWSSRARASSPLAADATE